MVIEPAPTIADLLVLARIQNLYMFRTSCSLREAVAKTSDRISESRAMMTAADDLLESWW
jgi:hypothetical protein